MLIFGQQHVLVQWQLFLTCLLILPMLITAIAVCTAMANLGQGLIAQEARMAGSIKLCFFLQEKQSKKSIHAQDVS